MSLKKTFTNAFRGLWIYLTRESNNRIHLPAAGLVVVAGIVFSISPAEWLFLVLSIGLVLTSEAFNYALERLCDKVHEEYNEQIKVIKDISAGAVLIAAIISAIVGLVIFLPKVCNLLI
jgi:diacylglycerol kinase